MASATATCDLVCSNALIGGELMLHYTEARMVLGNPRRRCWDP